MNHRGSCEFFGANYCLYAEYYGVCVLGQCISIQGQPTEPCPCPSSSSSRGSSSSSTGSSSSSTGSSSSSTGSSSSSSKTSSSSGSSSACGEPTLCAGGQCPECWVCCPDNQNCAATLCDCPGPPAECTSSSSSKTSSSSSSSFSCPPGFHIAYQYIDGIHIQADPVCVPDECDPPCEFCFKCKEGKCKFLCQNEDDECCDDGLGNVNGCCSKGETCCGGGCCEACQNCEDGMCVEVCDYCEECVIVDGFGMCEPNVCKAEMCLKCNDPNSSVFPCKSTCGPCDQKHLQWQISSLSYFNL